MGCLRWYVVCGMWYVDSGMWIEVMAMLGCHAKCVSNCNCPGVVYQALEVPIVVDQVHRVTFHYLIPLHHPCSFQTSQSTSARAILQMQYLHSKPQFLFLSFLFFFFSSKLI